MPEPFAVPRWRIDLVRVLTGGLGTALALTVAGTQHGAVATTLILAGGAALGLLIALGGEWVGRLRSEVLRLQGIERQADADRKQADAVQRHLEWQVQVAKREAAIHAVHLKVWSDAFIEAESIKRIPFDALMARIDVSMQAANLNTPIEPPTF